MGAICSSAENPDRTVSSGQSKLSAE
jgi:UDP-N-acetylglucosamine/UDP-N-acetylgalactosamine diphosphorylase